MRRREELFVACMVGYILKYGNNGGVKVIGEYAYDMEADYVAYRFGNGKARRFDGDVDEFAQTLPHNVDCTVDYKTARLEA